MRAAVTRLVRAHVDLAKAEFGEILDEVKRIAIGVGVAIGMLFYAGLLLSVGGTLFIGEWLFGSMGWGLLHGLEFSIAIAIVGIVLALGIGGRAVASAFLVGLIVAVIVGIVLGLDLTNQGWSRLGESSFPGLVPETRPLVLGVGFVAAVLGLVGLLLGGRTAGVRGAIGGLIGGLILGAILGAFTAISWGPRAGAAMGVAVGLAVWPALLGSQLARTGVDFDEIKARLWPGETIDTTRETIEWVRKQTPLGRKS